MRWLRSATWVLSVDADALLSGMGALDLPALLTGSGGSGASGEDVDYIFARDGNGINSGIALFRASPRTFAFLREAYAKVELLNHPWWEQAAFMQLLGEPRYAEHLRVVPQRVFNSYPPGLLGPDGWWRQGDLVIHWPGTKGADFARAVEGRSVPEAVPPCSKGQEMSVWREWQG